jgi:gliding motility-associated transport system ATP-binding protein
MIRVEGLIKDFGFRRAIAEISFRAEKGEVLGFLGPNGAGKTTTMRILAGFIPPTSGKAEVSGYDVVTQSLQVRQRVGYLPENVPVYPDMTVREHVRYLADLHQVKHARQSVNDVLKKVHLMDRADGLVGNLSKGMRQRLGLAQALIHKPEVLILDEPTIGLDPAQVYEVRQIIREVGREHTVMLSTHILSEVQQVCNRILIINRGRIVAEDTPERLQARLSGSRRVMVQVAGDDDGLEEAVRSIPGIGSMKITGNGSLEFETLTGQDIRPAVARMLVKSGFDLLEMRQVGVSLEDVFLQLTREMPTPPQVDGGLIDLDESSIV